MSGTSSPTVDQADSNRLSTQSISDPSASTAELTQVVDDLLSQLSSKFTNVSKEIFDKMDDMSRRLDSLEAAVQTNSETSAAAAKAGPIQSP